MSLKKLARFTPARIGLAHNGTSLKTQELLKLNQALAEAHDAVLLAWDYDALKRTLEETNNQTLLLHSRANSRACYLKNPDLGRHISNESKIILDNHHKNYDLVCIISDGLSASAIDKHFLPLWALIKECAHRDQLTIAPLCLVPFARVAIGDHIAFKLKATLSIVCIGERPGLSSPHSLGLYLTYDPHPQRCDADRNCISNIHIPNGLSYTHAAQKLWYLVTQSRQRQLSGVQLKESACFPEPKQLKN